MKKLSWITGILTCLMVFFAALGAVCGAIDQTATDAQFYSGKSRAAVAKYLGAQNDPQADAKVTEYIGLTDAEQTAFAVDIASFMAGEKNALPADVLNEKEQQHMIDVRNITSAAGRMSRSCFYLAAALAVVTAWTGARLKKRWLPRVIGGLGAVTLIALAAVIVMNQISAGRFEQMFIGMHELLFANDLWLMDPAADILIRMMPLPLFEQALADCVNLALRMLLIVWILLLAVYEIVSRMIRRHVTKS
ncbi:MAG: DUF1461 domain-containing protein [Clostridia bacterium]|nr:DUF1461 domain-containing protein [Clostridia bacterium]